MQAQDDLPGDAVALKRERIVSATWWLVWLLGTGWIAFTLANAWPHVMLPPQLAMLVTLPGFVFRSFDLAWLQLRVRRLYGWRRWLARLLSIPAGVALSAALWGPLDDLSMARFERALAPLLAQVEAQRAAPCPPAAGYFTGPALAAYLEDARAPRDSLELHTAAGRWVLVADGRSIDIDGSTIYYDSAKRRWTKYHNDTRAAAAVLETLVKGMQRCTLRLR